MNNLNAIFKYISNKITLSNVLVHRYNTRHSANHNNHNIFQESKCNKVSRGKKEQKSQTFT